VTTLLAPPRRSVRSTRRERRCERRRLKRLDALSAQLAELHAIEGLLLRAADLASRGWVQQAWFSVETSQGPRSLTAHDVGLVDELPVIGACLVGSVVQAAGGPETVRSQLVQRSLELTRHVLREPERTVRWCPGPSLRAMTVLELTCWNDAPERTQDEVVGLLAAAGHAAATQREACRDEREALSAVR
jgi:hypothetical protein